MNKCILTLAARSWSHKQTMLLAKVFGKQVKSQKACLGWNTVKSRQF